MGTFPFGWIRKVDDDNWQLLWNSETRTLFAKGAITKKVVSIGQASSWQEAQALAQRVQNEPQFYLGLAGD